MHPAIIAPGIVTGDAPVSLWPIFFPIPSNSSSYLSPVNPLSPNIHIQILQTDLYTFPLRIS